MKSLCSIKTNENGIHYFIGYKFTCNCPCGATVTILEIVDDEVKGLLSGGTFDGEISFYNVKEIA